MISKSSTMDFDISNNERLSLKGNSLFAPKVFHKLKPKGLKIYTFHAGFKKKFNDLLIIIFDEVINTACIYSKTSTPSAPIIWDKKNNKGKVKCLIVNSGNANAFTGKDGIKIIDNYVNFLCKIINCKKSEILVSSTGVIGEIFNPEMITQQILKLRYKKTNDLLDAAKSIMTTDTYPKISIKKIKINNTLVRIFGIAKGSGMIQPNMGTMLGYIFIEAELSSKLLKKLLKENTEYTFNSITVDSDTSTSDTLAIFSLKKNKINFNISSNFKRLKLGIYEIMKDLALKVIKDGEGLSKLIVVNVSGAKTIFQAKN